MKAITANNNFKELVSNLVLEAVTNGITSYDAILNYLPSVYPSIALNTLRELELKKIIPTWILDEALKKINQHPTREVRCANQFLLPVAHPLDYDWRFNYRASDYLSKVCLNLSHYNDAVAFLGTPSVFWRAVKQGYPRRLILIDVNMPDNNLIDNVHQNAQLLKLNILDDDLPKLAVTVVILDPPWYEDYIRAFLWVACQICAINGYILVSLPPIGTRPGIAKEYKHTYKWAHRLGLRLVKSEKLVLPYISPLFERNALKAEGIHSVPSSWRRGNLEIFVKKDDAIIKRPIPPKNEEVWYEEVLQGVRIRVRYENELSFRDPSLIRIVQEDILPLVSRRDWRRGLVDIWTSGNRVFACQGRNIFRYILRAMTFDQSPHETVANELGCQLSIQEVDLISKAAQQIRELVKTEQYENYLYEGC